MQEREEKSKSNERENELGKGERENYQNRQRWAKLKSLGVKIGERIGNSSVDKVYIREKSSSNER